MFSVYTMNLRHLATRYASIRKEQLEGNNTYLRDFLLSSKVQNSLIRCEDAEEDKDAASCKRDCATVSKSTTPDSLM